MKNQIWSPDTVNRAGGFQPFQAEGALACSAFQGAAASSSQEWAGFEILPETVEKLLEEPGVKARMDHLVQKRVNQALNEILERFDWMVKEGRKTEFQGENQRDFESELRKLGEHLESHWKLKFHEIEDQRQRMEALLDSSVSEWKQQRESLLKIHEQEWIQTLCYLLERFQMKSKGETRERLTEWLGLALDEFSAKPPVKVFVSSTDFQELNLVKREEKKSGWSFQEDKSLHPGQVRVEANNAGVIFDRDKNLQKVLQICGVE